MENNWKPAIGEGYWFVGGLLKPERETNADTYFDNELISSGNCFKTKEEAQVMADKFKEVIKGSQLAALDESNTQEPAEDIYLLPEWCKNADYLYDRNANEYACITDTHDSEVILIYDGDIEPITKSAKYIVDCCEKAKCKPLSDDELKGLVGKLLTQPCGDVSMVTDFRSNNCSGSAVIWLNEDWYSAVELVNTEWRSSNYKCGIFTTEC